MAKFKVGDIVQGCTPESKGVMFSILELKSKRLVPFYKVFCINHHNKKWIGKEWGISRDFLNKRYKKVG